MNYNYSEIAGKIRQERKKARLSQEELCDVVHISRNTLSEFESAKGLSLGNLRLETLLEMCRVFKCDVGYLLGEYEERTRTIADICSLTELSEEAVEVLCRKHIMTDEEREELFYDLPDEVKESAGIHSPDDILDCSFSIDRQALDTLFMSRGFANFTRSINECANARHDDLLSARQYEYERELIFAVQFRAAKIAEEIINAAKKEK